MGTDTDTHVLIPDQAVHMISGETPIWDEVLAEYSDQLVAAGIDTWSVSPV